MSLYSHHYAHKIVTTAISIKFCRPQLSNSPLQDQDAEHPIIFLIYSQVPAEVCFNPRKYRNTSLYDCVRLETQ